MADPKPRSHPLFRFVVPALVTLIILGVASPFLVNAYKNKQLSLNEKAVFELFKAYSHAQADYFSKNQAYAQDLGELNPAWAKANLDAQNPGEISGYRLRILTAQGSQNGPGSSKSFRDASGRLTGGFGLLGVPVKYGFTGRHTFLSSSTEIYACDLGVKGHLFTSTLQYFMIPQDAVRLE